MKRYCLFQCEKKDFKKSNKNLEIDLEKIILAKEQNLSNEENKQRLECWLHGNSLNEYEMKNILFQTPNSTEYRLDILLDTYIILKEALNHKVVFYDNSWEGESENRSVSEKYLNLTNFIYNFNNKRTNVNQIFDVSEVREGKINAEVSDYGIGIQRLWYLSKKFRNIFTVTQSNFKYEKNVISLINQENSKIKNEFHIDDKIILEKLIGRHSAYYYSKIWEVKDENKRKLLEEVMKLKGEYSRCGIIKTIYSFFIINAIKFNMANDVIQMLINTIQKELNDYNIKYINIVQTYITELQKKYLLDEALQKVEENIKIIEKTRFVNKEDKTEGMCNEFFYKLEGLDYETKKIDAELQKSIIEINLSKYE